MQFRILDTRWDKRRAQSALVKRLTTGAQKFKKTISWPDGYLEFDVFWHADARLWFAFNEVQDDSVYWDIYGTDDPAGRNVLYMSCQSTTQQEGNSRRHGGLFLVDASGNLYLAHTGKIGGGAKGVGKSTFVREYRGGNWHTVEWPDRVRTEVVVIGRISSPDFPRQMGLFASEVYRVKVVGKLLEAGVRKPGPAAGGFSPEFAGKRRPYAPGDAVESESYHGAVVNALHDEVAELLGKEPYNDTPRDLFLVDTRNRVVLLVEVKTDLSSGSIYQAIGQLFFNGHAQDHRTKLVLAVPGEPKPDTRRVLDELGIWVLTYHWRGGEPVFENLAEALRE